MIEQKNHGMLSPYRVLDLTDEKGLLCGKILADLGADVIKVEKPGGDLARRMAPFYHDEEGPDRSLFWLALNTNKKSVTLDIETAEGQASFKKLVTGSDLVIESFHPGYMERLDLGYSALERINPGIIMVSITPFGQEGPYRDYKTADIAAWAMGGAMHACGDINGPPVQISHHSQAYLHGGAQAAAGAMLALYYRNQTGIGQRVDVSIQESMARTISMEMGLWDITHLMRSRGAALEVEFQLPRIWPCKDGYVFFRYTAGPMAKRLTLPFAKWMDSVGAADDFFKSLDWQEMRVDTVTQETLDRLRDLTGSTFMRFTSAELYKAALENDITLYPMATTKDILDSEQLAARGYWTGLEHPELDVTITYPGAFMHASETPPQLRRRAPSIGEHNREVFGEKADSSPVSDQKNGVSLINLLDGVRVVDLTHLIAGPLITKSMADYGAEVIKIESETKVDGLRTLQASEDGEVDLDCGPIFVQVNGGKLSLTLNLSKPEGIEVLLKLVAKSDVVVDNFAGGTMKKMGIGYEVLKQVKPDIIMLSSCMMGQTGPYATHPGFGGPLTALTGINYITGWPDKPPIWIGAYTDFIAPMYGLLAIAGALDYRRRTGKGQYLDLSQYEAGIQFISPLILDYVVNGRIANRMGNRSGSAAPHGVYPCRGEDRWCAIAVNSEEEWKGFCHLIGQPALEKDPRFATLSARKINEDELDTLIERWTTERDAEEIMAMMQDAGLRAGVVQSIQDVMDRDPQLKHRNFFVQVDHSKIGNYKAHGNPYLFLKSSCEVRRAPLLGEHNEYVLRSVLELSDDEISELIINGVIE